MTSIERIDLEEIKDTLNRCKMSTALIKSGITEYDLGGVMCNINVDLELLSNQLDNFESQYLNKSKDED